MPWRIPTKGDPLVWEVMVMVPVFPRQLRQQFLHGPDPICFSARKEGEPRKHGFMD